ncbi:predicted protein, partial [Phaeodactylum tricornutum CCAP 1055/1]
MASLEIEPENELRFKLSEEEQTPRCTMTLTHPGGTDEALAFKVKTTQPRRYLVRPNQGLIKPGGSETIQILLVEKDKQALMQSFQRLGQSALDHSKDKFLVQSCAVSQQFASQYDDAGTGYDALSTMWTSVTAAGSRTTVSNKKLHVKHVVSDVSIPRSSTASPLRPHEPTSAQTLESMSPEQLLSEVATLRRKYDELVGFSVNLTAERDILNNTLEQAKRDLDREVKKSAFSDNKRNVRHGTISDTIPKRSLGSLVLVAILFFVAGLKLEQSGNSRILRHVPVVGRMLEGATTAKNVDSVTPAPE